MVFIGMDVHKKTTSMCVYDNNGKKMMERTIRGYWPKVVQAVKEVKERHGRTWVCFEASGGSGHLYDQLVRVVDRVFVAHPGKLRLISHSKRKNDRIDAEKLAKLLYVGMLPPVYVPNPEVRSWRRTIEHRERTVRKRTKVKNEIRSLLNTHGVIAPRGLWNKKGVAWLHELDLADDMAQFKLQNLLDELDFHQRRIRGVENLLHKFSKRNPAVALLMTIPGVGIRTAECLVAYIDDPRRFRNTGQVASYFGLVPRLDSTAGQDRLGHITKQGPPTARRLLVEASWFAVRKSDQVRGRFERIVADKPERRKIAVIAIAHYLLRVSLTMMRTGECWREAA